MGEICPKCGLPKELCICESIAKESQQIVVKTAKKKFGKYYTIIEGIKEKSILKDLTKKLKNTLACGGTVKQGVIELQGDHRNKIRKLLEEYGFPAESIVIKKQKNQEKLVR